MPLDDDDLDEPLSSRRALERSDHGKQEKKEQHIKEGKKKELSSLKLQVLKQNVQGTSGRGEEKDQQDDEAVKTKTMEEQIRQSVDTVHTKPGAEKLIQKEESAEEVKKQAAYEQSKDQTA